ncbi:mitochondrial import inner membrane translocase subunit TIM50-like isoform X1 [Amaranthus tricolor]|uniref:mitochondrial import inner membrane translocase subunit TIM50-like isoform X1 n=1 Tax=Amaranthus tricolor TaxID=29722 RepID=UPI00258C272C|nr:mitochondrial import inner membrane translocase subunit TIM50-like isoform X1 [Amaranthus tricolor]
MSFSLIRSRLCQRLSNSSAINSFDKNSNLRTSIFCRRFCTKEPPLSSVSSQVNENSSSSPPLPPSPPPHKKNGFLTALKFGLTFAVTGAVAAAGYATYAYTLEEVDEKTKAFRASVNYPIEDDESIINKLQASIRYASFIVPAEAIRLYIDLRRYVEEQVRGFTDPLSDKLLPDLPPGLHNVFTLVLDLNETLVYSDWKRERGWRTFKRPGVDAFLEHLAQFYEIVVYSDHLQMYVDPVLDRLDTKQYVAHRLSRAATRYENGKHYRDLSTLNRDPKKVIYLSGHALESCLQLENCIEIKPWKGDDLNDTTLLDFLPFLEFVARSGPTDIRQVLESYKGRDIPKEFIERSKEHQRRMQGQKQHGRFWRK